jgi:hypothetical protein
MKQSRIQHHAHQNQETFSFKSDQTHTLHIQYALEVMMAVQRN